MYRAVRNSLLSLISPQSCRVCSKEVFDHSDGPACKVCWAGTRIFDGTELLCIKCGAFLGPESDGAVTVRCHKCDGHYFDCAYAAGVYEKALAATVLSLKSQPMVPATLARLLTQRLKRLELNVTLAVPVPLSKKRFAERGYNQASLISESVARALDVEMDAGSLARTKDSPMHRAGMDEKARDLTVRNTFEVTRPRLVEGQNILLVDDVLTSGATASHCAKVLKKAGAASVSVVSKRYRFAVRPITVGATDLTNINFAGQE